MARQLDIASFPEKVCASGVCGGKVGVGDGKCICSVRRRGLAQVQKSAHHEGYLLLEGTALAHSGQFDAGGRVLDDAESVASSGQYGGSAGRSHGNGRAM